MARSRSRSPKRAKSASRGKSPGRKKAPSRSRSKSRDRSTRSKSRDNARSRTPSKKAPIKKKKVTSANTVARTRSRSKSRQRSSSRGSVTRRKSSRNMKSKQFRRKEADSDSEQPEDWLMGNSSNKHEQEDPEEDFITTESFDGAAGPQAVPDKKSEHAMAACLVLVKILTLPVLVLLLNLVCNRPMTENERYRFRWSFSIDDSMCDVGKLWYNFFDVVPSSGESYFDLKTWVVGIVFYGIFTILDAMPIGATVTGGGLSNGKRMTYRLTGIVSFLFCGLAFFLIWMMNAPISSIYEKYIQLVSFTVAASFLFSVALYARGASVPKSKRDPGLGNSGNFQLEFAHGREMHPRVGPIDLKMLSWRLGKLTWFSLNLMFMAVSYEYHDDVDEVLFVAAAMQCAYLMNELLSEENELHVFDVTAHGMGWLYVFFRQVFEPFIYTLTTKYLLEHREHREHAVMGIAMAVFFLGLLLYRTSLNQRLRFQKGVDNYTSDKTIDAIRGKRLMVDGFFRYVRYPHFTGELMMVVGWSLLCGFKTSLVFFPVLARLIVVMTAAFCRRATYTEKYGESYEIYCQTVKYRFVPYVF